MDLQLKDAAQQGDINALYALIRANPNILKAIDEIPFVDTPLHLAAAAGHIHFALEMMRLMPSFARKLNEDGFSPLHLALQNDNNTQIVLRLIHVDPGLIRVKGREGITPLHYVAGKGDLGMLTKFLSLCPQSIEDLTIRAETALHIAVKNNMLGAFEVLLGWLQRGFFKEVDNLKSKVLNWKDDQGNTLLHIAIFNNQPRVARPLIMNRVDVNAKNLENLTALDILERQRQLDNRKMKDILCNARAKRASSLREDVIIANHLRSQTRIYETLLMSLMNVGNSFMSGENRSAMLVVAVLIATATYHTGLNPPGGFQQVQLNLNSSSYGNTNTSNINDTYIEPFMGGIYYYIFQATNTIAFCASMGFIIFLIPFSIGVLLLEYSLIASYMFSVAYISPSFFVLMLYPLLAILTLSFWWLYIWCHRPVWWIRQVNVSGFSEQWRHQSREYEMKLKLMYFPSVFFTSFFLYMLTNIL